ncbi:hypothetical protein JRQ81_006150 [Phrynocephalus forsythii]|uniref:Uncharacterized protein n=1 Tax=Phrynocephalus forsythii TaxID=171643 RepID=A0A9Q0XF51_9SAUR|nr:hypothetical protein JRQ81_006150 [Phrynocephalus forsythii]
MDCVVRGTRKCQGKRSALGLCTLVMCTDWKDTVPSQGKLGSMFNRRANLLKRRAALRRLKVSMAIVQWLSSGFLCRTSYLLLSATNSKSPTKCSYFTNGNTVQASCSRCQVLWVMKCVKSESKSTSTHQSWGKKQPPTLKGLFACYLYLANHIIFPESRRETDSMQIMNEKLWKQEERKVKKWLRKQAQASPSPSYKSLQYKSSSYPKSGQDQNTEIRPSSGKESISIPSSQFGDHLPNFVSFLRLPTKIISYDRKPSKDPTPFSGMDFPTQTISARNASGPRNSVHSNLPPNRDSRKGSSLDHSISLQEAVALFPSLQRLATRGDRLSLAALHPHNLATGLPSLQKTLRNMLDKEREEERFKLPEPLPPIKPEEILSCRYLRLSQSNIDTLLALCKESGIYIDLHPHMKESDIDVSSVLSSSTITRKYLGGIPRSFPTSASFVEHTAIEDFMSVEDAKPF